MRTTGQQRHDPVAGNDESGRSRVEIATVVALLFVLATLIMVRVDGMTQRAYSASCASDAQAINQAVQTYLAVDALPGQVTRHDLSGSGVVQLDRPWPSSANYAIFIAGDGNHLTGMMSSDVPPVLVADNDVVVRMGTEYFDVTKDPRGACMSG